MCCVDHHNVLMQPAHVSPGLTVSAVARRLGVAPATLRTWDRRYGLGPSGHEAGAHRRYSAQDMVRLEHMRRLVIAGVPPVDAARDALHTEVHEIDEESTGPTMASVTELIRHPAASTQASLPEHVGRAGGGSVIALPGASASSRGLARAALALDGPTCSAIIDASIEMQGVIATWNILLVPVLAGVGERWRSSGKGIEIEHTLTGAVVSSLSEVMHRMKNPLNGRAVILAAADREQHSLPLWAVAAGLAERRISVRLLSEPMPAASLAQAVQRIGPAAVLVWSQTDLTGDATAVSTLPQFRPAPCVLVGGPGWFGDLPRGVDRVSSLPDAVERIARAVGE
jgi:DNA-binding transcriptional MerR regulator